MARDFDAELDALEQQAVELREAMAGARVSWLEIAAPWLAQYWIDQARDTVVEQSEHAEAIGAEGVKALKTEVEALASRAPALMTRRLVEEDGKRLWPDVKPQTDPSDPELRPDGPKSPFEVFLWSNYPSRIGAQVNEDELKAPPKLEAAMSRLQSEVLEILLTHKFQTSASGGHRAGGSFRPLRRAWTREMVDAINKYAELHDRYVQVLRDAASVRRAQSQAQASDLWNSA